MDGIINVYKEKGFTSHDVVAKLRGILHMKKIGHTGTLDPDAVGVLPVCLGAGTKLCGMITEWSKTYEAVMLLGTTTDTLDITGNVTGIKPVNVNERQVVDTVMSFLGEYDQIPPMYSALKHNGKKLYELAREGIEIERKPRRVNIKSIIINEMNLSDEQKYVTFTVECSKGTYIRSLCDDIGKKLGCGACMMQLTRTQVGKFGIDDSLTLNQIAALCLKGEFEKRVTCADAVFDYSHIVIKEEYNKLLYNGNALPAEAAVFQNEEQEFEPAGYRCVYDAVGQFIGVYIMTDRLLKPVKMFYTGKTDEM